MAAAKGKKYAMPEFCMRSSARRQAVLMRAGRHSVFFPFGGFTNIKRKIRMQTSPAHTHLNISPNHVINKLMTAGSSNFQIIKSEFIRKAIHFLIALSPLMAAFSVSLTLTVLAAGILSFICFESLRIRGITVPLISTLTLMASRQRDQGRFVLGPITLGLGAFLALSLFPLETASIAIYALAFGDGFAGLVGKTFGNTRPAFLYGKSLEGSLACFFMVFISSWRVCRNLPLSLSVAFTASIVEALPLEDFDNILLPLAVGLVVYLA